MEYVAIGILAVLVIGGGFTAMILRATRASTPASPESDDSTPLGDTQQHSAGDAEGRGGTGGPTSGQGNTASRAPSQEPDEPEGNRFKRDPIGGEGEGRTTIDTGDSPRAG